MLLVPLFCYRWIFNVLNSCSSWDIWHFKIVAECFKLMYESVVFVIERWWMTSFICLVNVILKGSFHLLGILDVCHETLTKGNWSLRYCCIKDGQLECYHEKTSDGVEMAFSLHDADIQNASKETKKDLSIKLSWESGDYFLLDVSVSFCCCCCCCCHSCRCWCCCCCYYYYNFIIYWWPV